jgi:thiol peroxidase
MDLPFAQARWCGAAGVKNVKTLSDHRDASFGTNYGLLMKEVRLLARAVLVVDRDGKVQYIELVKEIAQEPDFDAALTVVKKLT